MWILWPPLVFDQCFLLHSSPSRRWSGGGRWVPLQCRLRAGCGQTQLPSQQGDIPPRRLALQRRPAAARGARGRPQSLPACRQLQVRHGRPKPNAISDPARPKGVWVLPVQGAGQLRRRRGLGGERGCSGASHRWGASPLGSKRKSTRWDFFFRGIFYFFPHEMQLESSWNSDYEVICVYGQSLHTRRPVATRLLTSNSYVLNCSFNDSSRAPLNVPKCPCLDSFFLNNKKLEPITKTK